MKNFTLNVFTNNKWLAVLIFASIFLTSCSKDDDNPKPVNEEEIITTMTVTLTPEGGGTAITLKSQDLDGDGPNAPVVTVSGNLSVSSVYTGKVVLLNETENPAEDITTEVKEEANEHQFFYIPTSGLNTTITYTDKDSNNNPIGIDFKLVTTDASTGTLGITLRHEPKKPNNGTLADAAGETDISVNFNITIQ